MMGVGRVVGKGVGRGFNRSFEPKQVSLHSVWLSECILRDEIGQNRDFRGVSPIFGRESPCNDITFSEKHHVLAPQTRRREISPNYLCKKEQPYWKTEKLPHFEFLNLNISLMNGRQVLIF